MNFNKYVLYGILLLFCFLWLPISSAIAVPPSKVNVSQSIRQQKKQLRLQKKMVKKQKRWNKILKKIREGKAVEIIISIFLFLFISFLITFLTLLAVFSAAGPGEHDTSTLVQFGVGIGILSFFISWRILKWRYSSMQKKRQKRVRSILDKAQNKEYVPKDI